MLPVELVEDFRVGDVGFVLLQAEEDVVIGMGIKYDIV